MSKYKEGDRFIIELGTGQKGTGNMTYYRVKGANTYLTERELDRLTSMDNVLQRLEYEKEDDSHSLTYEHDVFIHGYNSGLNEAIEIVKKGGLA